jgi:hypothetical protein
MVIVLHFVWFCYTDTNYLEPGNINRIVYMWHVRVAQVEFTIVPPSALSLLRRHDSVQGRLCIRYVFYFRLVM